MLLKNKTKPNNIGHYIGFQKHQIILLVKYLKKINTFTLKEFNFPNNTGIRGQNELCVYLAEIIIHE